VTLEERENAMVRNMPRISQVMTAISRALGRLTLCAIPLVLLGAWLGAYVGSDRTTSIADGRSEDGRIAGLGKITTLYCYYLTFQGLRTNAVHDYGTTTKNGIVVDISCPWFYPKPFVF
jgi:hypothetical protein